jgi:tetratricopeptide (TPR) repeat protein
LFHLGALLVAREDIAGAIECYRRAIAAKPAFADAHVNLGLLLKEAGDAAMAIGHLEAADRLRPNDPRILNNLGMVREQIEQSDAIEDFRRALALDPQSATAAMNLARVLASVARHSEAIGVLEATLNTVGDDTDAAEPHSARSLVALGNLHRQIGQFEKAHVYYQRALELDPQDCGALVGVLKHLKSGVPEQEMARIAARANDTALPLERRRQLHFALSQCREAAGEFDAAFQHMKEGNLLRRLELEPKSGRYDPGKKTAFINRTMEIFDASYFHRVTDFGVPSEIPVFIVGVPRSGTTLCEQILASHSRVFGADEIPDIGRIANGLQRDYVEQTGRMDELGFVGQLTKDAVRSIAEQYLDHLRDLAPRAARVVDKLLTNYRRLGLIATPGKNHLLPPQSLGYGAFLLQQRFSLRAADGALAPRPPHPDPGCRIRGRRRRSRGIGAPTDRILRSRMGERLPRILSY